MIKELEYPAYVSAGGFQRISWGAVIAGAITSLSVLATMALLGAGIGMIEVPWRGLAVGFEMSHAAWIVLSGVISFYAGGWIAGRVTPIARVSESVIHGFIAWGAASAACAFVIGAAFVGRMSQITGFDPLTAATISGEMGILGRWAFLTLACGAAAALFGARAGTRVLRPVPMAEIRRERVGI